MSRRRRVFLVVALLCLAAGAGGVLLVPGLGWRAKVVALKAEGRFPDLSWRLLFTMMKPHGRYYLRPLLSTPNLNAVVQDPFHSADDLEQGKTIFRARCAVCHGMDGHGTNPGVPDLATTHFKHGSSDWALFTSIRHGIPGTAMPAHPLSTPTVWQLVTYVRSLAGAVGAQPEVPHSTIPGVEVTSDRLRHVSDTSSNWLNYSRTYDGHRYSGLRELNRRNVHGLALRWAHQMPAEAPLAEATPLVVDGTMYVTEPPGSVRALDAATGAPLWSFTHDLPGNLSICCGTVNRGVAVLGDRVYVGTLDAHLIALDARTGEILWDDEVADYRQGYSITAAPLAVDDMVVTGIAGGEYGIRGFIDAYDASTGSRRWRFYTIPGPGDPGSESWPSDDTWKRGGGPTWLTGAFDPASNTLFWGVGNPSPDFNGDKRPGANLYTNSVVALDADSGTLEWFFQFTPHDEHDWDAVQIPVLFDAHVHGQSRHLMGWANRNGFYYLLDRDTGRFLLARPFVRQTWAERIDSLGRPVLSPNGEPTFGGTEVWPWVVGGTNWWSPSLSSSTGLLYVPFTDRGSVYVKGEHHFKSGELFEGSATLPITNEPPENGVKAIVPTTGEVRWKHDFEPGVADARPGGVLSTAGGLVFGGVGETFYALDALTGEELWHVQTGGRIMAGPMTYRVNGRQLVSVCAGRTVFTFGLPEDPEAR